MLIVNLVIGFRGVNHIFMSNGFHFYIWILALLPRSCHLAPVFLVPLKWYHKVISTYTLGVITKPPNTITFPTWLVIFRHAYHMTMWLWVYYVGFVLVGLTGPAKQKWMW